MKPKHYFWLSFASLHTKKNIGVCIVAADDDVSPYETCKQLKIPVPKECHEIECVGLGESAFQEQGLELNRFYTPAEMDKKGYKAQKADDFFKSKSKRKKK